MEKIDEVVLELRRELEKSKHTNVYTGMYANRQLIRFQRFFFFQDKMSIMLPEDFYSGRCRCYGNHTAYVLGTGHGRGSNGRRCEI